MLSLRQRLVAAVLWLPLAPRTTSFRHVPEDGRRDPWVPATVSSNLADWGSPKLIDVWYCLMIFVAGKISNWWICHCHVWYRRVLWSHFIYGQTFSGLAIVFPELFGGYEDFWNKSSRNIMDLTAMVRAVPTTYHAIRGELGRFIVIYWWYRMYLWWGCSQQFLGFMLCSHELWAKLRAG